MKTKCPVCTADMTELPEKAKLVFHEETFTVNMPYYSCENRGHCFTSDKQTQEGLNDLARQYAKKHGVDVNTLPIYSDETK